MTSVFRTLFYAASAGLCSYWVPGNGTDVVVQGKPPVFFAGLFIAKEEIEPTPTLETLYTDNPVNQTTGLAWINRETIKLLRTGLKPWTSACSTTDSFYRAFSHRNCTTNNHNR